MNCKDAHDLILDLVDERLGSAERKRLETHIGECARCARELEDYRVLSTMLDESLTPEPVPHGFADGIIATLREAGRITERRAQRARVFAWIPAPLRVPAAAFLMALVAVAVFPATIGLLEAMVGKGTVLVADTYIELQEKATDVGMFTKFVVNLQKDLHMLKTVVLAASSLVARAGEMFMIPALLVLLVLVAGVFMFVHLHRRGAHHASFSI
jgi:hypothetical protein